MAIRHCRTYGICTETIVLTLYGYAVNLMAGKTRMQTKLVGALRVVWLTCCIGVAENRGEVHSTAPPCHKAGAPPSNVSRRVVSAGVARSDMERPGIRFRWIRRLAAAEVNLAIRISAWHAD